MSAHDLDKILHQAYDKAGWDAWVADADRRLQQVDLTAEERDALLGGDVPTLHRLGVNEYLLLRYGTWFGIVGPAYFDALRADQGAR